MTRPFPALKSARGATAPSGAVTSLPSGIVLASRGCCAALIMLLGACAASPGSLPEGVAPGGVNAVADLQIVDCLLPGRVRQLGNAQYLTPRRPIKTTAGDCRVRGGEYTAYDRANYKTALNIWMPAAQAGDAEAQTNVGEIYERGLGGEPNYQAAVIWYRKAADQGDTRAQFNLGTLYEQGLGVEKNRLEALNWYRKAWDIPEDDILYQSAANQQAEDLRKELEKTLRERESRIRKLESDMRELESQSQASGNASMEQEIEDLRLWIDALESERTVAQTQLDTIPRTREPVASSSSASSIAPGASIKSGNIDFGRYYALVIGNQRYTKIDPLRTPENDATQIANVLRDKYGFNVQVLLNVKNNEVMETINDLNEVLGENDNLLIYYAGHGARVTTGKVESGYWLPVNADAPPRNTYWVSNEFVTGHLSRIKAKRVMVMADSCYAGLLSDAPGYLMMQDGPQYTEEFLRYKLPKRSRLLMTSGGDKPVLDNGASGHSVFASVVLETLQNNTEIMSGPQLFATIEEQVRQRAAATGFEQQAEYKVIKGAGHEVGDFFFVPI